jgi:23S rRNA (guanosine2251-2'-O)-methyltransferase
MTALLANDTSGWVWGKQSVLELLRVHPQRIEEIIMSSPEQDPVRREIHQLGLKAGIPVIIKPRRQIDRILPVPVHQAVVARLKAECLFTPLEEVLSQVNPGAMPPPVLLALDHITDPQNFGALIRTAYCTGVQGIIFPKDRSCPVSGTVRKAAAGALEYMPLVQVVNLVRALEQVKEKGFWVLSLEAGSPVSLFSLDLRSPLVIVLGGESQGVGSLVKKHSDWVASLPMKGAITSLNVSAACAAVLYEVMRQNLNP